ncbi:unnamed protein product [Blepharisma stoltei]|uniref:Uncharacterized protein n=1 Tax=Blepharisma stoltei TaxID=1481888 RepID=A0AAU9J9J2_9CILI|nr:unnamed protein product [Blepharisma stoltei]
MAINRKSTNQSFDSSPTFAKTEDKITEYYNQLHDTLESFDTKVNTVIHSHEKDFLGAFRNIMAKVKKEMTKLRELTDEQALMIKRDQVVQELQNSLYWFQNEAVKLGEACSKVQARYDNVKQKVHGLEAENIALEQQVKILMRQNETLKENLGFKFEESDIKLDHFEEKKANLETDIKNEGFLTTLALSYNIENKEFIGKIEDYLRSQEISFLRTLDHQRKIISNLKKQLREFTSEKAKGFLERSDLEDLFLDCVEEVRKEVVRRKSRENSEKRNRQTLQSNVHLTAIDKRLILEKFIANEQVIAVLYDTLFPWKGEKGSSEASHPLFTPTQTKEEKSPRKGGLFPEVDNASVSSRGSQSSKKRGVVVNGKLLIDKTS